MKKTYVYQCSCIVLGLSICALAVGGTKSGLLTFGFLLAMAPPVMYSLNFVKARMQKDGFAIVRHDNGEEKALALDNSLSWSDSLAKKFQEYSEADCMRIYLSRSTGVRAVVIPHSEHVGYLRYAETLRNAMAFRTTP
jgi:hypothetical protein